MKKVLAICLLFISIPAFADDPTKPDPALTPGAWNDPPTALDQLCKPGFAEQRRHVTKRTMRAVFREYGFDPKNINRGNYEVDHLVSIEIDGTNDIKNLWPESYVTTPLNAHRKDVLENALHRMVCNHQIDLATAQHDIATDWIAAYNKYVLTK